MTIDEIIAAIDSGAPEQRLMLAQKLAPNLLPEVHEAMRSGNLADVAQNFWPRVTVDDADVVNDEDGTAIWGGPSRFAVQDFIAATAWIDPADGNTVHIKYPHSGCDDYVVAADGSGTHLTLAGTAGAYAAALAAGGKSTILMCNDETISTAMAMTSVASSVEISIRCNPLSRHLITVTATSMFTYTQDTDLNLHFFDLRFTGSTTNRRLFAEASGGSGGADINATFDRSHFSTSGSAIDYIVRSTITGSGFGTLQLRNCTGRFAGMFQSTGSNGLVGAMRLVDCDVTFDDEPVDVSTSANWGNLVFEIRGGAYVVELAENWCSLGASIAVDIQDCSIDWNGTTGGLNLFHVPAATNVSERTIFRNVTYTPHRRGLKFFGMAANFLSVLSTPIIFENIDGRATGSTGTPVYMIDVATTNAPPIVLGPLSALPVADWSGPYQGPAPTTGGIGGVFTIRENGTDQTVRSALNIVDTDAGTGLVTDDSVNNETELNLQLYLLANGVRPLTGNWVQSGAFGIWTAGSLRVGSSTAPTNVAEGDATIDRKLVIANAVLSADDEFYLWAATSSRPIINFDSGDFYFYDRSADLHEWRIGNTAIAQWPAGGVEFLGYGRFGSLAAPTNTTPGDVTATRLIVPNATILHSAITQLGGPLVIPTLGALLFSDTDNSNYVGLRSPATAQSENYIYELPDDDPVNGQVLAIKSTAGSPIVTTEWIAASSGASIYEERATQAVAAGTTISVTDGEPLTPFTTASNITNTAAPFIAAGRDGQLVILRNDGAFTLNISDTNIGAGGSLLRLSANTVTMAAGSTMALEYSTIQSAWVQLWYLALVAVTPAINTHTISVDGGGAASSQNQEVAASGTQTAVSAFTYTGVPSSGSTDISAGGDPAADWPVTLTTPFLTHAATNFNKGTSVGTVRTFTPSIVVNGVTKTTPTATVTYINRRYAGPNSQSTLLSSAQVLGLDGAGGTSDLSTSQYSTFVVTTAAGEYFWLAHRSALTAIAFFSSSGEIMGFTDMGTLSHTNDQGFVETFRLYRSTLQAFGASKSFVSSATRLTNRIYTGPESTVDPILTAEILALSNSVLQATVPGSYAVTISGSDYLWFCHPDAIADIATIKDNSTGFAIAGSYRTDVTHTNAMGFVETYRCWRSDNVGIFPSGGTVVVT